MSIEEIIVEAHKDGIIVNRHEATEVIYASKAPYGLYDSDGHHIAHCADQNNILSMINVMSRMTDRNYKLQFSRMTSILKVYEA